MKKDWYVATASHVLEAIDQALRTQSDRTYVFRIVDHIGPEARHNVSIPFDYENSVRYRTDHEANGADFGLINISPFYRKQMEANPQTPIDQKSWQIARDFEPVAHVTLGIPNEEVSSVGEIIVGRDTINHQSFKVVGLQVKQISEPPPGLRNIVYPTFWAELSKTPDLNSIKGMSGCPILAFGKTKAGEVKYEVAAVQSGWYYERMPRIIYGSDFRSVMHDAEAYFDQHSSSEANDE
jgi:hypothetical protein